MGSEMCIRDRISPLTELLMFKLCLECDSINLILLDMFGRPSCCLVRTVSPQDVVDGLLVVFKGCCGGGVLIIFGTREDLRRRDVAIRRREIHA